MDNAKVTNSRFEAEYESQCKTGKHNCFCDHGGPDCDACGERIKATVATFYFASFQDCSKGAAMPYFFDIVLDKHPVDFILAHKKANGDRLIALLFWSEITKEQYEAWNV